MDILRGDNVNVNFGNDIFSSYARVSVVGMCREMPDVNDAPSSKSRSEPGLHPQHKPTNISPVFIFILYIIMLIASKT